ncbi:MAG: putative manganese-dependent inorganic diphosphatase [Selenomonas sp.]|nr:putative manganese-dependent inorganic diphosphatase [Selenomonas sp.]
MNVAKPIYVIGHRNPDTDSICSAIGYAHLKQAMGVNAIAARAGKVNKETRFALEYFHVEKPLLIPDLYPRVKDIAMDCKIVVRQHDTLRNLGEVLRENDLRSIPVTDSQGLLVGSVSVTIKGQIRIAAGSIATIKKIIKGNDIVLVGDRKPETILTCINQGISCLVVTGDGRVPAEALEEAETRGIFVLSTPYDTYTVARLINQCVPIRRIMHDNPVCFKPLDLLSDIKGIMEETNYRNYPVLENGRIVGLVSRDRLGVSDPAQVILVDHNERNQAVEGIEEAKIIEIIDHHRFGGISTSEPIYTHAEPVGCTATIVSNMHWQNDIDIPPSVAGLLLSAIISDTVLFKSPTCTPKDKQAAERLAEIADVDMNAYGLEMLKAGSSVGNMTPMEIVRNDLKEFTIGAYRVVVSQTSVMDTKEIMEKEDELLAAMKSICDTEGFDLSLVMITDILEEATYLLFTGSPRTLIGEAFRKDTSGTHLYLPGVMSRKKQIIPPLSEAVKRIKT